MIPALNVQNTLRSHQLVEPQVILRHPAKGAMDMRLLQHGLKKFLKRHVELEGRVVRFQNKTNFLKRFYDLNAQRPETLRHIRPQSAGHAQIMLPRPVHLHRGKAIEYVHVLVGTHTENEPGRAIRRRRSDDRTIKKPMIAGGTKLKRQCRLMHKAFVERGQHGFTPLMAQ